MSAWTGWWQQDLISEWGQGLAYWTYKYYTRHIIASFYFQSLLLEYLIHFQLYPATNSYLANRLTRGHEIHNYLSFGHLFVSDYIYVSKKAVKWQIIGNFSCSLVNLIKYEFVTGYGWKQIS